MTQAPAPYDPDALRQRILTLRGQKVILDTDLAGTGRGGRRYLPYAFTEHGAIMAATVLNSPKAVEMSVFVVRAFVKLREQLLATLLAIDSLTPTVRDPDPATVWSQPMGMSATA